MLGFERDAVAPIYYVELPFTQHAFDITASARTSATTRAAVAFATSVVSPAGLAGPSRISIRVPAGDKSGSAGVSRHWPEASNSQP